MLNIKSIFDQYLKVMKISSFIKRVFRRVQKGTLALEIKPIKMRTVYPKTRYTFNQFQAYMILVIRGDFQKFNSYADSALTPEQKKEVLDTVKLSDIIVVDPKLN